MDQSIWGLSFELTIHLNVFQALDVDKRLNCLVEPVWEAEVRSADQHYDKTCLLGFLTRLRIHKWSCIYTDYD